MDRVKSSLRSRKPLLLVLISPVIVVIHPKQIATVMKPSFWLTIYMYKQHIKNQTKSNIWNTVKFEEQILHYFCAGQNVNMHTEDKSCKCYATQRW